MFQDKNSLLQKENSRKKLNKTFSISSCTVPLSLHNFIVIFFFQKSRHYNFNKIDVRKIYAALKYVLVDF